MANARAMLEALGEPMRVLLLERLIEAPSTATELARALPVTRSAVSQHLQVLKAVGLVGDTRAGTSRIYAVDPDALGLLRSYFDAFWTRSLDSFRRTAEATALGHSTPHPDPTRRSREHPDQPHVSEHRGRR